MKTILITCFIAAVSALGVSAMTPSEAAASAASPACAGPHAPSQVPNSKRLSSFKKLPAGISVTNGSLSFDRDRWRVNRESENLYTFERKDAPTSVNLGVACACPNGQKSNACKLITSDDRFDCSSSSVCGGSCGQIIIGSNAALADAGFEVGS